jgi:hypothetical protein
MAFDPLLGTINDMDKQLSTHYLGYGRFPSFCQVAKSHPIGFLCFDFST